MAHIIALRACMQYKATRCLILENDIYVPEQDTSELHSMKQKLKHILLGAMNYLPPDWKMLNLGRCHDHNCLTMELPQEDTSRLTTAC
mmetsp:Transcript_2171/g.7741  ORF Transcript_2171/g.7741 Transcript_2171/m.7741 type:complete len:88 (-) Transcript_2171:784-1047(-)